MVYNFDAFPFYHSSHTSGWPKGKNPSSSKQGNELESPSNWWFRKQSKPKNHPTGGFLYRGIPQTQLVVSFFLESPSRFNPQRPDPEIPFPTSRWRANRTQGAWRTSQVSRCRAAAAEASGSPRRSAVGFRWAVGGRVSLGVWLDSGAFLGQHRFRIPFWGR